MGFFFSRVRFRDQNMCTRLVAGDLVQWTRSSVGSHVVLLDRMCNVVLQPLAWTGVGQLN